MKRLQKILEVQPEQFDHQVHSLRSERTIARLIQKAAAEQEALGNTVVDGAGYGNPEHQHPNVLLRADGKRATKDDANAVVISTTYRGEVQVTPVIGNWRDHCFTIREGFRMSATAGQSGPMTDTQKEERRTVIQHSKKWESVLLTELRGD